MIRTLSLKKRIKELYQNAPADSRVICFDEFGPLELRSCSGSSWAPVKWPNRLAATYRRLNGVRHLLAAYDLKDDKLFAHVKKNKTHKRLWLSCNI